MHAVKTRISANQRENNYPDTPTRNLIQNKKQGRLVERAEEIKLDRAQDTAWLDRSMYENG